MTQRFQRRAAKSALLCGTALLITLPVAMAQDVDEPHGADDQIEVRSSVLDRPVTESLLGTSVLTEEELARRADSSIGETLRREPGISSTFFGPAASRPVIRGLGGDRVRVLDSGIGSIDASATSVDHAVAVEPALADRIEILRGTAMLLYGSSAAGGVVNVYDGRIPDAVPENGFDLGLRYGHSTVDNGDEIAGAFNVSLGQFGKGTLVLHGDGFWRETEDYDIPGFAESARLRALEEDEHEHEDEDHDEDEDHGHEEEEEEVFGTAENSALSSKGGSGGISYVFDGGYIGFSGKVTKSLYGIPGGHAHEHGHEDEDHEDEDHEEEDDHDHEEEHGEENVTIDLDQTRYDLAGEIAVDLPLFQAVKFRAGYADYTHTELEGHEVGTVFSNEGWETRLELKQKQFGNLSGAVGVQLRSRDFSAIGAEAFVPPTETFQTGIFVVEEWDLGHWLIEAGARYEHTSHEAASLGVERDFDSFSLSAGAGLRLEGDTFLGATIFRTERAPATEELFANGPHLATGAFEVGNPDLDLETALGIEATAHTHFGPFKTQVNLFYTTYSDFIYEAATGEEEDELPVFAFLAEDATFMGFEAKTEAVFGTVYLPVLNDAQVYGDASLDYVDATLDVSGNDNLPRIPPLSGLVGVGVRSTHLDLRAEAEFASDQDDVTEYELPTDGYTQFNLFASVKPFTDRDVSLDVKALNLTDEEVRLHTSFLKDLVPLQGRNIRVSLRAAF